VKRTPTGVVVVFGALVLGQAGPARAAEQKDAAPKPNIIFFLADDLGLDGVGCCGSDAYQNTTPHIDALARTGVRFENCYATPLCGPSRCLFLTGRYGFRTGGLTNESWRTGGPGATSHQEHPIARLLKEHGYATCQTGKWRQIGETPRDWGFDEYCTDGTPAGWYWGKNYIRNGEVVHGKKDVYCPDVVHHFAVNFIERHQHRPFFLYYATHLVHVPMERTPDSKPGTTDEKHLYADNIAYLDKQLGLLVKELDRLKLRERTLIVFSGDNGTLGRFSCPVGGRAIHGHKGQLLEGGSRVPLIANWKGVAPTGKVVKDLIDFSDLYPTFAEVAGARLPKELKFDGHSFAPQLRGEPGKPREWVYVQLGHKWYVRSPGWKLTDGGELFDMRDAPFVEKLVADAKNPEASTARRRLHQVLDALAPARGKVEKEANPR
jgi:arylsulfatase A